MLDDRARLLLKTLVERYIADGHPVGSRALTQASGLDLSPATIRNVMADLEGLGLIASPHTSAGRVPTAKGYRLFVDTMLTVDQDQMVSPEIAPEQPQRVIASAAGVLSDLSQFVGVVQAPRKGSSFRHIEFLRLSEKRILVILVSPDGDVQNRVIFTESDYSQSQLIETANYLNAHYAGLAIDQVRQLLRKEVEKLRDEIGVAVVDGTQLGIGRSGAGLVVFRGLAVAGLGLAALLGCRLRLSRLGAGITQHEPPDAESGGKRHDEYGDDDADDQRGLLLALAGGLSRP